MNIKLAWAAAIVVAVWVMPYAVAAFCLIGG